MGRAICWNSRPQTHGSKSHSRQRGGEVSWRAWWWGSAQSYGTVFLWSKGEMLNNVERVHYSFVLCADCSGRLLHYRGLLLRLAKAAPWPAVYDKPASSIQMSDRNTLRYWGTAGAPTRVSRAHLPQLFCLSFLFIPLSPRLVSPWSCAEDRGQHS